MFNQQKSANLNDLKTHWKALISQSRFADTNGIDRLSTEIGRSSSYLRGLLNNTSIPKIDVVMALALKLHRTVDELLEPNSNQSAIARQIGKTIGQEISQAMTMQLRTEPAPLTGKDIMQWWNENNGRLENCGGFKERFDLYKVPEISGNKIIPHKLGKRSLATQSLGTGSPELLEKTIAPLGPDFSQHILKAHQSSIDAGPVTTMETLDAAHPTNGSRIKIQYLRTLAPVTLPNGTICVLNYSELMGRTGIV
jgi:transcriptional regulator with XRE-family HTH domain